MKKKCCSSECCCDMHGLLSFLILWLLSKKSMHGQEIAEELNKRRGIKPSPGTIYPALKELSKRNLIKREKVGKLVIYSLTEKGRKGTKDACDYFCSVFFDVFKEHKNDLK